MQIFRKSLLAGVALTVMAGPAFAGDVMSGNDKVSLKVSGQVSKQIMYIDDENTENVYFADSDTSGTRFRMTGDAAATEDLTIGFRFEVEMQSNASNTVTQSTVDNATAATLGERYAHVSFASKKFGKVTLGQTDAASNGITEIDLSGAAMATSAQIGEFGGAYNFYNTTTNAVSTTSIGDVSDQFDGFSRDDLIRYDTPKFAGFSVAASTMQGGGSDIAVRYSGEFAGTKIAGGVAFMSDSNPDGSARFEDVFTGSISALHESGLNLTYSGSTAEAQAATNDDTDRHFVGLGYKGKFTSMGATSLQINWMTQDNAGANNQEYERWGLGVSQKVDAAATDLYASIHINEFEDGTATNYDDIIVGLVGARVKF